MSFCMSQAKSCRPEEEKKTTERNRNYFDYLDTRVLVSLIIHLILKVLLVLQESKQGWGGVWSHHYSVEICTCTPVNS